MIGRTMRGVLSTRVFAWALLLACVAGLAWAQTVTGVVLGTVTDPSGQAIPGASVTLISEATGDQRSAKTEVSGSFMFPAVPSGAYTIRIESQGFQRFEKTGNRLTPNERLSLGSIQLAIGSIAETVTVTAQGMNVQTASAEGSALLTSRQLDTLSERSRDIVNLLRTIPGVQTQAGVESFGAEYSGVNTPNAGGLSRSTNNVTVDGATGADLGSGGQMYVTYVSFDAISEVKILTNSYQAEYGRGGGPIINVVTKGGTRDFHGTAYWYKRHEMFNANNFFNNRNKLAKPMMPVRELRRGRGRPSQHSQSVQHQPAEAVLLLLPGDESLLVPSVTRRKHHAHRSGAGRGLLAVAGSRTSSSSRSMIPTTMARNFPKNKIPANRVNKSGQALLNMLPHAHELGPQYTEGNLQLSIPGKSADEEVAEPVPN